MWDMGSLEAQGAYGLTVVVFIVSSGKEALRNLYTEIRAIFHRAYLTFPLENIHC